MTEAQPATLSTSRYLESLYEAMVAFVRHAERAGLEASVPTCPGWTVRDLVAHQGMVHRWASAALRGEDVAEPEAFERQGWVEPDPLEWMRDGAVELAQSLSEAPEDVAAPVFLKGAPSPRTFWARRQCHETTMHAVDALAASLGRLPTADDVWFGDELAADGIDELLVGFLQRGKYQINTDPASTLLVRSSHPRPAAWLLHLSPDAPVVTQRIDHSSDGHGDWHLSGHPTDLYLQLWQRAPMAPTSPALLPADWWSRVAITW